MRVTMTTTRLAALAMAGTFGWVLTTTASQEPAQKTVRDGVYTTAQATRGKTTFDTVCSRCHALDSTTQGLDGPPLGGETFFASWSDQNLYTLVQQIMLAMPPDGSVTLEPAETADVVAYLLQANSLPAGEQELKADASARAIRIVPPGSGGRSDR
jgi:mono/diheme cytochrome c family protein